MIRPLNIIISVSDKTGILELARELTRMGSTIISTGGTAALFQQNGIDVQKVSELTGFPEILGGRVKTLHPVIYGGLLADRNNAEHLDTLKKMKIKNIDMVVVNLYPFVEAVEGGGDAVENIDIGGVALIRAAAKNHEHVVVLTNPSQYHPVLRELDQTGAISPETRKVLAVAAFKHTSAYDASIQAHFAYQYNDILKHHPVDRFEDEEERAYNRDFPPFLTPAYRRLRKLRYGENPHQRGALYQEIGFREQSILNANQLNGRKLSYNNMLDFTGALNIVREFEGPTAVLIKHNNPCGVASANTIAEAYDHALACDPMSSFGGIISLNREVDVDTARVIKSSFKEGVVAPSFQPEALEVLKKKKKIILLEVGKIEEITRPRFVQVEGGLLLQDPNHSTIDRHDLRVVSVKHPEENEIDSMLYAWKVIKHIRSNAILLVKEQRTVGIGAGQMSRVDSALTAVRKAGDKAHGSVMASDAFIPFRDSVDVVAEAGITAIIQPGGSIRDQEVLDAVNGYGLSMVYTGTRNFKH